MESEDMNWSKVIKKIEELEARVKKLESIPQARKCELCGHTTFEQFVPYSWGNSALEDTTKTHEICPSCARNEYTFEEKMRKEEEWRTFAVKPKSRNQTDKLGIHELKDN